MTPPLRGEAKTPGGKLVAVEFEVSSGRLVNVTVTGDFFLYPEEALPLLAASLEGAQISGGEAAFQLCVADFLDRKQDEIDLVGTSPEAIATAISRALAVTGNGANVE